MNPYGDYPDLTKVRRILVIKLRHHGDVLLTSPVFSVLKRYVPQAEIFAFIYGEALPMLDGHPAISGFHLYDNRWKKSGFFVRMMREYLLVREIRAQHYDMVINLTEGDRGTFAELFSMAPFRIGVDPGPEKFGLKRKAHTHVVKASKKPRHMVEQNLDAARRIGVFPDESDRDLTLVVPEETKRRMSEQLRDAGITLGSYVLIHPTSRWMFKCWPSERVAEIIRKLASMGHRIVLTGAPEKKELDMIEEIMSFCPHVPLLNLAGKLDLKELAAVIHMCRCLLCVDSVPFHMASAFKVPAVVVFGPTSDAVWGPWKNQHARVVSTDVSCRPCNLDGCGGGKVCDCIERIPVQRVFEEIMRILGKQQDEGGYTETTASTVDDKGGFDRTV